MKCGEISQDNWENKLHSKKIIKGIMHEEKLKHNKEFVYSDKAGY